METVSRKFEDTSLVPANLRALILFGCALSDPKHQEKSEREPAASRAYSQVQPCGPYQQ